MLQRVALLGRAGGEVVAPAAGGVDLLDQANQHALVLPPHALKGDQLEPGKEADQHVAHPAIGQLVLVQPAELKGGDADAWTNWPCRRIGRRSPHGDRRDAFGHDLPVGRFAVLILRLNLVVEKEVSSAEHGGNHEHDG